MNKNTITCTLQPAWNTVFAVALGVAGLITSEFLPVSLLTPMASDLHITEGTGGQAISVTAIVAMVSSIFIASATRKFNRRYVLLTFCLMQAVSNLLVAAAPNFTVLLSARILLGIGLGGFWSMAAATAMRLVPKDDVPRALSIIYVAVSLATVVAAPLGSYLGAHIGWRNVFIVASVIGVLAFIWQYLTLPSMVADTPTRLSTMGIILRRPVVIRGMLSTLFAFMSYATFFTYLRPFLETVTGVSNMELSIILLVFGIANLIGSSCSRYLLAWNISRSLSLMSVVMCLMAGSLALFSPGLIITSLLVAIWGMALGVIQVGWTAWLTQTVPDEAESGGGLQIAVIQLAITTGALLGGILFDHTGSVGVYICSSLFALIAALAMLSANKRAY